ncbi:hypothetical protein ACIBQ1_51705 [Nonomuraea sp. NPDC050153]|uniref:hypothetical protein n=1 Tax=Nonomuraea sp. NPDC050153 TaxID=3364359 RepID=UPI0037B9CB4B
MSAGEARFTVGLLYDVTRVLEEHGYRPPADESERGRAMGRAMSALFELVHAYEGREGGQ